MRRLGNYYRLYRFCYNVVSIVTLLIPIAYSLHLQKSEAALFSWAAQWQVLRIVIFASALSLFWAGSKEYDMLHFLGISQLSDHPESSYQKEQTNFSRSGVSSMIRHPWYLGGILFVWSVPTIFYPSTVITAAIITAYFLIGTLLEERKLLCLYGEAYAQYQQRVSMLFPVKWLYRYLADSNHKRQARKNTADDDSDV